MTFRSTIVATNSTTAAPDSRFLRTREILSDSSGSFGIPQAYRGYRVGESGSGPPKKMKRKGTKNSRTKLWRKELKASWSRKRNRRDKVDSTLRKEFKKSAGSVDVCFPTEITEIEKRKLRVAIRKQLAKRKP